MSDSETEYPKLCEMEYFKFIALYRAYPELLNPPLPTSGVTAEIRYSADSGNIESRTRALHKTVYESDYIKQLSEVPLKQVFRQLETLLANTPEQGFLVDEHVPLLQRNLGRMRRELRFLRRYADIIKHDGCELSIPIPAKLRKDRLRLAKSSRILEHRLNALMTDQFLLDALGQYSLPECRMMLERLLHMADVFERIEPIYPIVRDRDHLRSIAKTLIHQLADCCFRVYESCDSKTIRLLILPSWLRTYIDESPDDIEAIIAEALVRKVINFDNRISEMPWDIDIDPSSWEPPTSL